MSVEKPHIIITDSNGQEQSDSYQNSIFENVSEQQEKLFYRVTSSDNQPKNQQPNVETIPQQDSYHTSNCVSSLEHIVQTAMLYFNTLQQQDFIQTW